MTADPIIIAIATAEARALGEHEAGRCHLSEWSCSHCPENDQ